MADQTAATQTDLLWTGCPRKLSMDKVKLEAKFHPSLQIQHSGIKILPPP